MFQINNYMVDLLALPLLLEATIIAIDAKTNRVIQRATWLALLLGVATAFKLANLFIALPVVLAYLINLFVTADPGNRIKKLVRLLKSTPTAAVAFLLSIAPFTSIIFR